MKTGTFDLECDNLLEQVTRVWCAVVKDNNTGDVYTFRPTDIPRLLPFLDTFDCLMGHNVIQYDFAVLRKLYGWEYKGKIIDTLIMSRTQRPARPNPKGYKGKNPHSVEAWGHRFGQYKKEHEDWSQFSEAMLERCLQDVEIQHKIYKALIEEGKDEGWEHAHKLNMRLFHYLQLQEEYGWTIDKEHLEKCIGTLNHWINRIDRALHAYLPIIVEVEEGKNSDGSYKHLAKPFKKDGGLSEIAKRSMVDSSVIRGPFTRVAFRPIDLDSNKETKEFLLKLGWQPAKWNVNDDGERTSPNLNKDDPFEGIQGSIGRLVAKRVQCRQRKSVLEGWQANIRPDGRIATRVAGIATTGRLRHASVVNIPSPHSKAFFAKQMRQCFVPRDGWVMVGCDSKGNQMRQLAARMGDEEFTYAVLHGTKEEGTDLHSLNQKRSGAASRNLAKNFFYGCILFGAGDAKTAKILQTDKNHARKIKEDYFKEMPALANVIEELKREWKQTARRIYNPRYNRMEYINGHIRGIDGRHILVKYEKDLLAYALQSDEAIHLSVSYVMMHKWIEKAGYKIGIDWGPLIFMHDEVQVECRTDISEEIGDIMCKAITWAGEFLNIQCKHEGEVAFGRSWYETH